MSGPSSTGEFATIRPRKADVPTRRHFADRMVERGATDRDFVVFESDIGHSTFSYLFGERYPDRYFNMGIAEMATVSAAAGFAAEGRTVFVCGYGVFLTMRAVEVVRSFVCYPRLNVKFFSSHAGLTAAIDGVTHQATEDVAFMTTLPGMQVLAPCDRASTRAAFDTALETPGPVFTRLMRDPLWDLYTDDERFPLGGSKVVRPGTDLTIATYGDTVIQGVRAAEALAGKGISAEVLDLYSLKPVDCATVLASVDRTGALLVVENHQRRNGLGYELAALFMRRDASTPSFDHLGLDDRFGESGDYERVIDKYGISARRIAAAAEDLARRTTRRRS
jgi:transketolase